MDEGEFDAGGVDDAAGAPRSVELPEDYSQIAIGGMKSVMSAIAGLVPGIGLVTGLAMGTVLDILFPGPDVWSELRDKVKEFVHGEINQAYFDELQGDLRGIRDVAGDYSDLAQLGQDPSAIRSKWLATETEIAKAVPRFEPTGAPGEVLDPVPLLPLFVQVVHLHLILLRDMALHGQEWGFESSTVDHYKAKLAKLAGPAGDASYMRRAKKTYERGYGECGSDVERMSYERGMVMNGYAQHTAWEFVDVVKYPNGHDVNLDWVVYVGPFGRITGGIPATARPHPGGTTSVRDLTVYTSRRVTGARWQPWASGPDGPALTVGKTDTGKAHPVESGDRSIRHLWGYGWPASVEFGVLGLAFGVGATKDDKEKAPPGWIGDPSLTVNNPPNNLEFFAPGYFLSDIRGGKYHEWGFGKDTIEWMAFGFRTGAMPYRPSADPVAGHAYLLQSVHDGRYLVPQSAKQNAYVLLSRDSDSKMASWHLTDGGLLRNQAASGFMRVSPQHSVRMNLSGTPFKWVRQEDDTYAIFRKDNGGCLVATEDGWLMDTWPFEPKNPRMRWAFRPVVSTRRTFGSTRPSFDLETRRKDVGYFEATVTVSNPGNGRAIEAGWHLSFLLPKGLGSLVNVTGDPVTPEVITARPVDRGLLVELRTAPWSAKKDIKPGESFTFTLTGEADTTTTDLRKIHIQADIPRINGIPINNTWSAEDTTHTTNP
ncbi:insecticidal delta-endotoxin Cry8Ea1 family protein [Streptomyces sp. Edi2]|uniref:insecticidal delta-endotoxin Cry8Ea1 family protein n=1 Tax=Streptomyces sp. Edi2 TaxID=3162528 RepID=UPI0033066843